MADIGFKATKNPSLDVRPLSGSALHFNSAYFVDKIMAIAIGVNLPHGLTYKPTLITSLSTGNRDVNTWVDNYQIYIGGSTSKGIALSQQGT